MGTALVLLVVGIAAFRDPRWQGWAVPCLVGFGVTTIALVLFTSETTWLLGHGGWERLLVAAPIVWVVAAGVKFLRHSMALPNPESVPAPF